MRKSGISAQAAAAQILGWGAAGKKLAESRKVGKSESRKVAKYIKKFRTVELSEMFCRVSFSTCRAAVDFMSS